ncbi:MAG: murein DD-endopeptidase [Moritella sp.]|jgi:murein DD-endopeptidase
MRWIKKSDVQLGMCIILFMGILLAIWANLSSATPSVMPESDREMLTSPSALRTPATPETLPEITPATSVTPVVPEPTIFSYEIKKGDTLSAIFEQLGLTQNTLYQILEVDLNLLALDSIKPGQILVFTQFEGQLTRLELQFSLASQVVYQRQGDNGFEFTQVELAGEWREHSYTGQVEYSFTGSVQRSGVSLFEAQFVADLLKDKIDFKRDLRRGDEFKVLISRQYVGTELTGANRIEAVIINNRKSNVNAYLYEGSYYDAKGASIEKAFIRRPITGKYRISSSFNPKRRHPITGLLRPHNGTDFAVPIGTPVLATADGVVSRVVKHKYAGLYIEISHGQTYRTRYLHLSKALVKKGQRVTRGQKIALSGNSGRSTGAHLHYELHISGRAVNAMTAPIPIAKSIAAKDKAAFALRLSNYHAAWSAKG